MAKVLTINISQFKARSLELLDALDGTAMVIVVTKRGKPIATVQAFDAQMQNKSGKLQGSVLHEEDIVAPLGDKMWKAAK